MINSIVNRTSKKMYYYAESGQLRATLDIAEKVLVVWRFREAYSRKYGIGCVFEPTLIGNVYRKSGKTRISPNQWNRLMYVLASWPSEDSGHSRK